MLVSSTQLDNLDFEKSAGLMPAVVQHAHTGTVLMLGYMNRESLQASLERHKVVFYSRSRRELWEKGATSGHVLELVDIRTDCDRDALLVRALPLGPTCHLGTRSCFGDDTDAPGAFLGELDSIVAGRRGTPIATSYTARLLADSPLRRAQKVGEEGLETALAGACQDDASLLAESADLVFHLLVLLHGRNLGLGKLTAELERRHRDAAGATWEKS
jgi:phosphoribosyl-ATP pyrophosphohydrolase/phosphoribosyl-AMP cyclohydrolase